MTLRIRFRPRTGRVYYTSAKDDDGWYQVTGVGKRQ